MNKLILAISAVLGTAAYIEATLNSQLISYINLEPELEPIFTAVASQMTQGNANQQANKIRSVKNCFYKANNRTTLQKKYEKASSCLVRTDKNNVAVAQEVVTLFTSALSSYDPISPIVEEFIDNTCASIIANGAGGAIDVDITLPPFVPPVDIEALINGAIAAQSATILSLCQDLKDTFLIPDASKIQSVVTKMEQIRATLTANIPFNLYTVTERDLIGVFLINLDLPADLKAAAQCFVEKLETRISAIAGGEAVTYSSVLLNGFADVAACTASLSLDYIGYFEDFCVDAAHFANTTNPDTAAMKFIHYEPDLDEVFAGIPGAANRVTKVKNCFKAAEEKSTIRKKYNKFVNCKSNFFSRSNPEFTTILDAALVKIQASPIASIVNEVTDGTCANIKTELAALAAFLPTLNSQIDTICGKVKSAILNIDQAALQSAFNDIHTLVTALSSLPVPPGVTLPITLPVTDEHIAGLIVSNLALSPELKSIVACAVNKIKAEIALIQANGSPSYSDVLLKVASGVEMCYVDIGGDIHAIVDEFCLEPEDYITPPTPSALRRRK